jgi:hypothetical protein
VLGWWTDAVRKKPEHCVVDDERRSRDGPLDCDKVILALAAVIVRFHLDSTL